MQVSIGNTDISQYVQEKSYKIDSEDEYTEWKDSVGHKHRGGYISKVSGSFELVFIDGWTQNNTPVDGYGDFLTLIANNSTDKKLTITLTVNNLNNATRTIVCYYKLTTNEFKYTHNGSNCVVKRVLMTIEER